jgi:signal transduction histidine kinase
VASAHWAGVLLKSGTSWPQIAVMFPEVMREPDGTVRVSPRALAQLDADRFHRLNRYSWEGAFFLTVILGAMAIVGKALKEQTALRRRQDLFLAASSHELKSPMASLRLSADTLALRDPDGPRRRELVQRIHADLGRLDRTIANILDAARLAGDGVRLAREDFVLSHEVEAVVDELRLLADEHGVRLVVDIPRALTLHADREGVHTVVRNLVHNAIKASRAAHDGGVVTLTADVVKGQVRLMVRDRGIGFEPAESVRLFDKFYRIETTTGQERLAGTGLGLYLVRRCVELEGGTVQAASDGPDRGACFTARWPAPQLTQA